MLIGDPVQTNRRTDFFHSLAEVIDCSPPKPRPVALLDSTEA